MFIEVCIVCAGLFASSEIYRKISGAGEADGIQSHRTRITKDDTDISVALDRLTAEVSLLREDIVKLQKMETGIPVSSLQPARNKLSENSGQSGKSSIFKQIIEDNIKLRSET